jgi:hypothetical protein
MGKKRKGVRKKRERGANVPFGHADKSAEKYS